jgi:hypothetical protein
LFQLQHLKKRHVPEHKQKRPHFQYSSCAVEKGEASRKSSRIQPMNLIECASIANRVGRVTPCAPSQPCCWTGETLPIIETRTASWTAAVLRRFFDGSPKIESPKTPAATLTGSWKAIKGKR